MNPIFSIARLPAKALCVALMLFSGSAVYAAESEMSPNTTDMPTVVPGNQETAESVFEKLDNGKKGYVSKVDATVLPGFEHTFQKSDANHDGKLTLKEFKIAWAAYAGNTGAGNAGAGAK